MSWRVKSTKMKRKKRIAWAYESNLDIKKKDCATESNSYWWEEVEEEIECSNQGGAFLNSSWVLTSWSCSSIQEPCSKRKKKLSEVEDPVLQFNINKTLSEGENSEDEEKQGWADPSTTSITYAISETRRMILIMNLQFLLIKAIKSIQERIDNIFFLSALSYTTRDDLLLMYICIHLINLYEQHP